MCKYHLRANPLILFYVTNLPLNDYTFLDFLFLLEAPAVATQGHSFPSACAGASTAIE